MLTFDQRIETIAGRSILDVVGGDRAVVDEWRALPSRAFQFGTWE